MSSEDHSFLFSGLTVQRYTSLRKSHHIRDSRLLWTSDPCKALDHAYLESCTYGSSMAVLALPWTLYIFTPFTRRIGIPSSFLPQATTAYRESIEGDLERFINTHVPPLERELALSKLRDFHSDILCILKLKEQGLFTPPQPTVPSRARRRVHR